MLLADPLDQHGDIPKGLTGKYPFDADFSERFTPMDSSILGTDDYRKHLIKESLSSGQSRLAACIRMDLLDQLEAILKGLPYVNFDAESTESFTFVSENDRKYRINNRSGHSRIFDFFNQFLAGLKGLAGNFPYVNIDAIYEHIMDLSRSFSEEHRNHLTKEALYLMYIINIEHDFKMNLLDQIGLTHVNYLKQYMYVVLKITSFAVGSEMRLEKDKTNLQMIVDHELKDVYVHCIEKNKCVLSDNKITTLKLKELHLSEVEGKENTYSSDEHNVERWKKDAKIEKEEEKEKGEAEVFFEEIIYSSEPLDSLKDDLLHTYWLHNLASRSTIEDRSFSPMKRIQIEYMPEHVDKDNNNSTTPTLDGTLHSSECSRCDSLLDKQPPAKCVGFNGRGLQAESTAVPQEVHDEAEFAAEVPGNDQFKDTTDVLVPLSVPMIEAQLKATFQDGIEQVLSSDHRDEDENANEQEKAHSCIPPPPTITSMEGKVQVVIKEGHDIAEFTKWDQDMKSLPPVGHSHCMVAYDVISNNVYLQCWRREYNTCTGN